MFIPTTPAKTDLNAQFSITLSTMSSCGVLMTFGSPTDGTKGGLCLLASSIAGMIPLSGSCSTFGTKFWCSSLGPESAMLDCIFKPQTPTSEREPLGLDSLTCLWTRKINKMAYQTFQQEYMQMPVVTRTYATACVVTTLAVVRMCFLTKLLPFLTCTLWHSEMNMPSNEYVNIVICESPLSFCLFIATGIDNAFSALFQSRTHIPTISGKEFVCVEKIYISIRKNFLQDSALWLY